MISLRCAELFTKKRIQIHGPKHEEKSKCFHPLSQGQLSSSCGSITGDENSDVEGKTTNIDEKVTRITSIFCSAQDVYFADFPGQGSAPPAQADLISECGF